MSKDLALDNVYEAVLAALQADADRVHIEDAIEDAFISYASEEEK
jgi:hypothetical protein